MCLGVKKLRRPFVLRSRPNLEKGSFMPASSMRFLALFSVSERGSCQGITNDCMNPIAGLVPLCHFQRLDGSTRDTAAHTARTCISSKLGSHLLSFFTSE